MMILVDTSVWADHFRKPIAALQTALVDGEIVQHPFVTGEIALGNLRDRRRTIEFLDSLQPARQTSNDLLLEFVQENGLGGAGIDLVDSHLLACAADSKGMVIWTLDKRLFSLADRLGIAYSPD